MSAEFLFIGHPNQLCTEFLKNALHVDDTKG